MSPYYTEHAAQPVFHSSAYFHEFILDKYANNLSYPQAKKAQKNVLLAVPKLGVTCGIITPDIS